MNDSHTPQTKSANHRVHHVRARAHAARAEERLDPTVWIDEFPHGVASYLLACHAIGFTFEQAWTEELDRMAIDAGFKWRPQRGAEEPSLSFAKRHFRSFYETKQPGSKICCVMTCTELAIDEYQLCEEHGYYE